MSLRGAGAILAPAFEALNCNVPLFGFPASSSAAVFVGPTPDYWIDRIDAVNTWNPNDAQKGPASALGIYVIDPTGFFLEPLPFPMMIRIGPRCGVIGFVLPEAP